jgi:hypothetical protein
MYRRHRDREKMVLAVHISGKTADGVAFDLLTHTIDISDNGGRLGGMQDLKIRQGEILEVRRKQRKARFRVVWIGQPGTRRFGHIGIQAIGHVPNFWGFDLPVRGEAATTLRPHALADEVLAAG